MAGRAALRTVSLPTSLDRRETEMPDLYETLSLILARDVALGHPADEAAPEADRETHATASDPRTRGSTASRRSRLRLVPVRRAWVLVLGR